MIQLTDPFALQMHNTTDSWINDFVLFNRNEQDEIIMPANSQPVLSGPIKDRRGNYSYEEFMDHIKKNDVPVGKLKLFATSGNKFSLFMALEYRQYNKAAEKKPDTNFLSKILQPGPPEHNGTCTFFINQNLSLHSRLILDIAPYTNLMLIFYKRSG